MVNGWGDGEVAFVSVPELLEVVFVGGGVEGFLTAEEEEVVVWGGWLPGEEVYEREGVNAVFEAVGFEWEGGAMDYVGHSGNDLTGLLWMLSILAVLI